ncbi:hypothetical protein KUTeg_014255 [Tegillarca granosa]|uniref:Uncharacterized protein n=1 Tax=Tegillarca granosa TaxID=220873 RepID=A0ABQ9EW28_TEGGR|nr:hypothetical protein KUTeg_014255 [Tegillarca granosa]
MGDNRLITSGIMNFNINPTVQKFVYMLEPEINNNRCSKTLVTTSITDNCFISDIQNDLNVAGVIIGINNCNRNFQVKKVIFQTIKDVSRLVDWKPGVTTVHHTNKNGAASSWKDTHVGCDMVTMTVDTPVTYLNNTNQIGVKRKWHRENNGCCWLLECEQNGFENIFYLIQPLEDLEKSSLTILAHLPWCSTVEQMAEYTARLLLSLKDYFIHRKLKSVPLIDIKIPNDSLQNNNYVLQNDPESSPSEEEMFKSEKTFFQLKPKEQLEILEKSESILKLGTNIPRKRQTVRRRSSSDSKSIKKALENDETRPRSHTENDALTDDADPSTQKNQVHDKSLSKEDNVPSDKSQEVLDKLSESVNKQPEYSLPLSEPDTIKYITSANHCAAEIQGIAVRVSEMDLRKNQRQQSESTNGWIFCGLEHDIVIMNRIFPTSCKIMSYLGKGLIHASPQTVFEARVDILNTITDKIKTVVTKWLDYRTCYQGQQIYSMVTYVMQMDFSQSRFQYDSPQLKELISRQPLSIIVLDSVISTTGSSDSNDICKSQSKKSFSYFHMSLYFMWNQLL